MSLPASREVVFLSVSSATTNGTGPVINVPMGYTGVLMNVDCLTVSGTTSPTLNVYAQIPFTPGAATDTAGGFPSGTLLYQDVISFTQLTTSGTVAVASLIQAGAVATLQQNQTLTAATVNNGIMGDSIRIAYKIGGTGSPTFSFTVSGKFVPMG